MHLRPQQDNSKTNYPCEQGTTGNMAWNTLLTHKFVAWNTLLTPPGGVIPQDFELSLSSAQVVKRNNQI